MMTDYRSFVESKLAELDRRREEIEIERKRLANALSVLDEADDATRRHQAIMTADTPVVGVAPMPATIVSLLRSSGQMMTADEIYGKLSQEREVTRAYMYSALHRLKMRNTAFKAGKAWGLVGRDDRENADAVDSAGHEEPESSLLTPPPRISPS